VNKKVLGIVLTVSFLAMLAIPVMAAPATKVEGVTATADGIPTPSSIRTVSHGSIRHIKGTTTGTVYLTIPGLGTLEGTWNSEWVTRSKISQDPTEALIASKLVWAFTGEGTTGTFEGVDQRKIIGGSYFEDRLVLHGTGDFKGQTLKLSYKGTPPVIDEGVLIIPK
jgi:hypothetical protein